MYYVYALIDPIQKIPFYIGKGKGNRMFTHLKEQYNFKSKKLRYIETIRCLGYEPIAKKIVDNILDEKEAYEIENFYIKLASKVYSFPLVNRKGVDLRPPSRKGSKWSKASIEKRENTVKALGLKKNRKLSEDQKLAISKAHKGKKHPDRIDIDIDLLKQKYLIENLTKSEICSFFNIKIGVLSRIIKENEVYKTDISKKEVDFNSFYEAYTKTKNRKDLQKILKVGPGSLNRIIKEYRNQFLRSGV